MTAPAASADIPAHPMGIIIFEASTFWTGTPTGISLIVLWKEIQGIRRQFVFVAVGRRAR